MVEPEAKQRVAAAITRAGGTVLPFKVSRSGVKVRRFLPQRAQRKI
jgi:hypothetical protein